MPSSRARRALLLLVPIALVFSLAIAWDRQASTEAGQRHRADQDLAALSEEVATGAVSPNATQQAPVPDPVPPVPAGPLLPDALTDDAGQPSQDGVSAEFQQEQVSAGLLASAPDE